MAKGARLVRKSAPARSEIRIRVNRPRTDQRGDERLRRRTKVLRRSFKTGAEWPVLADSEASITKTEEEVATMRTKE